MTRTTVNKALAVVLAMFFSLTMMSVVMMNNAKAAEEDEIKTLPSGVSIQIDAPEKPAGAPDVSVVVNFPDQDGYEPKIENNRTALLESFAIYSDAAHTKLVPLNNLMIESDVYSETKIQFTIPLSKTNRIPLPDQVCDFKFHFLHY